MLQIAEGKLQLPIKAEALIFEEKKTISILWEKKVTPESGPGNENDRVEIICYNEVEQDLLRVRDTVFRFKGESDFRFPDNWKPEDIHIWIYMRSFELDINSKSIYLELFKLR